MSVIQKGTVKVSSYKSADHKSDQHQYNQNPINSLQTTSSSFFRVHFPDPIGAPRETPSSIRLLILSQKASSVHKFSGFYFALFLQDSYFLACSTLPALAVLLSRFPSAATPAGISKCRTWHAARSVHPENIRHRVA